MPAGGHTGLSSLLGLGRNKGQGEAQGHGQGQGQDKKIVDNLVNEIKRGNVLRRLSMKKTRPTNIERRERRDMTKQ